MSPADKDMPESDRVCHILKGIGEFASNALVLQSLPAVSDVISTSHRLQELQSIRLPLDMASTPHIRDEDLRAMIRAIVCEEMYGDISKTTHGVHQATSAPDFSEMVKEELPAMPVLLPPINPLAPSVETYSEVTGRYYRSPRSLLTLRLAM